MGVEEEEVSATRNDHNNSHTRPPLTRRKIRQRRAVSCRCNNLTNNLIRYYYEVHIMSEILRASYSHILIFAYPCAHYQPSLWSS